MTLQFHRAVEDMEIWSASSDGVSFVISYETSAGPGFHGRPGYVASWRPLYHGIGAIRITGSPFKAFAEAEEACNSMLKHLNGKKAPISGPEVSQAKQKTAAKIGTSAGQFANASKNNDR